MKKSLVDIAYNYLLGKKVASFKEIYTYVLKQNEIDKTKIQKYVADLHTDMIYDNRFFLIKENQWGLRSDFKFDDIKKQFGDVYESLVNDESQTVEGTETIDLQKLEEIVISDDLSDDDTISITDDEDLNNLDDYSDDALEAEGYSEEIDWNEVEEEILENN